MSDSTWLRRHPSGRYGPYAGAAEGFWQLYLDQEARAQAECPVCGLRDGQRPSWLVRMFGPVCSNRWHRVRAS